MASTTVARNREFASALTMARTVLERWPGPNAHQLVGTELAALGQHQEAIVHLRDATRGYAPARFQLGSELLAVGAVDEAIDQLREFVREEPGLLATRSAHGLLADALAGRQAFGEAIPHYREYLAANPDDGRAWTGLAIANLMIGQTQEAVNGFRRAAAAEPGNVRFQLNLARALLDTGRVEEAAALAQQAAAAGPTDPAAYELLARVLASQGDVDGAREQFERALRLDPSFGPALDGLRSLPNGRRPR